MTSSILIIGAGSWGTALGILLAQNGNPTKLWGRERDQLEEMAKTGRNRQFLPDYPFPDLLQAVPDLGTALENTTDVLVAVPSVGFRDTLIQLKTVAEHPLRLAWATKGLDPESGKLLHAVVEETFADIPPYAVISGPTFAKEVAAGLPTAITLAANQGEFAEDLCRRLHSDRFRVYTSDDIIGVEIGGAVKNVLAIAAGIADGLGFGANTRAALVTRGLAEIMRLGVTLGGQRDTFMGLAGLGDLVLTCTDNQSRNRRLGLLLAQGKDIATAQAEIGQVIEGLQTAHEVHMLATETQCEMPIAQQVYAVLYENKEPGVAVRELLTRQMRPEGFG